MGSSKQGQAQIRTSVACVAVNMHLQCQYGAIIVWCHTLNSDRDHQLKQSIASVIALCIATWTDRVLLPVGCMSGLLTASIFAFSRLSVTLLLQ